MRPKIRDLTPNFAKRLWGLVSKKAFAKLTDSEIRSLHKSVALLRVSVDGGAELKELEELIKKQFPQLSYSPITKQFIEDCKNGFNFTKTWQLINFLENSKKKPNHMLLCMNPTEQNPNIKSNSPEYIHFERLEVHPEVKARYIDSNFVPIVLLNYSKGFDYPTSVAVFSESIQGHNSKADHKKYPMYAFMGKMADRSLESTIQFINSVNVSDKAFSSIKNLSRDELIETITTWIFMHEHYHQQGLLPYQDNIKIKARKKVATFEELRVDCNVILDAYDNLSKTSFGKERAKKLCEFIIAERLSYALREHPEFNFDSRTSAIVFKYLQEAGSLTWTKENNLLDIDFEKAIKAIRILKKDTEEVESEVYVAKELGAKPKQLRAIMERWVQENNPGYSPEDKIYWATDFQLQNGGENIANWNRHCMYNYQSSDL